MIWVSICVMLALAAGPAAAQSEPDSMMEGLSEKGDRPWAKGVSRKNQEAAREIFREGNELLRDSLFAQAADKYREALKHWDHPGIHYNLALALINLDQPIAVYEAFGKAMEYGATPIDEDKLERARSYRMLLEQQLAQVEIVCEEPGANVSLDGKFLFAGPGTHSGLMRAGEHSVVASKRDYLTETRQLVLSPGEKKRVEITLLRLDQAGETVQRWSPWLPWSIVAGGLAIALGGGTMHWRAAGNFDSFDQDFNELCAGNGCLQSEVPELADKLDRAEMQQKIALTSYIVGGVVVTTGLVMVFLNQPRFVRKDRAGRKDISFIPVVTPDMAGVSAGFRF
jgi:hypothetical protein